jgi:asparagine synthase (glutamine-hydrolysing)
VAITVDHPRTRQDREYAESAALALRTQHTNVSVNGCYQDRLTAAIAATGEPPNHVQSPYFAQLAQQMRELHLTTGLCGEGADSLFGTDLANRLSRARRLSARVPSETVRFYLGMGAAAFGRSNLARALRLAGRVDDLADLDHPVNTAASFTHRPSVESCFGKVRLAEACAYRRGLLDRYRVPPDSLHRSHAVGFLGEAIDTASLWTILFESEGVLLRCPYLDSRLLRVALNIDPTYRFSRLRQKWVLKEALMRHLPVELVNRPKLGFGQPIFEWMATGGQLRPMVDGIRQYDFVPSEVLASARAEPNWFLFSLLCYDSWFKTFIEHN